MSRKARAPTPKCSKILQGIKVLDKFVIASVGGLESGPDALSTDGDATLVPENELHGQYTYSSTWGRDRGINATAYRDCES